MRIFGDDATPGGQHSKAYVPCQQVVEQIARFAELGKDRSVSDLLGVVYIQTGARCRFEGYARLARGAWILAALLIAPAKFVPWPAYPLLMGVFAGTVALVYTASVIVYRDVRSQYARETEEIYQAAELALRTIFLRGDRIGHLYMDDVRALELLEKNHPWLRNVASEIRARSWDEAVDENTEVRERL